MLSERLWRISVEPICRTHYYFSAEKKRLVVQTVWPNLSKFRSPVFCSLKQLYLFLQNCFLHHRPSLQPQKGIVSK